MIQVQVFQNKSVIRGFEVSGHAGYEAKGQDIVCAGVSALTQTALLGLEKFVPGHYQYEICQEGYLKCRLDTDIDNQKLKDAQVILETMLLGLESIQEQYGDYIVIAVQEVK